MKNIELILIAMSVIWTGQIHAWGKNGHRIVAEIAETHLKKNTLDRVMQITSGRPLASISNWADEIKSDPEWNHAYQWHYVNIKRGASYKKADGGDLVWAIQHFANRLKQKNLKKSERFEALAFLVHFVGDLHQPLHCGYAHDKGGNKIKINWFKQSSNLHRVWDEHLIEYSQLSYLEWIKFFLIKNEKLISEWKKGKILDWVKDNRKLFSKIYPEKKTKNIGYRYHFDHKKTLILKLNQGGVRLAKILNETLL